MKTHYATTLAALLLVAATTPVLADDLGPRDYIANGHRTVWCDGLGHDDPLKEPECLALNAVHGDEGSAFGGAEWEVDDFLGWYARFTANDLMGTPHILVGIGDHAGGFYNDITAEGCGSIAKYQIPADAPKDADDGDVDLIAQISVAHIDATTGATCLGSMGTITIDVTSTP